MGLPDGLRAALQAKRLQDAINRASPIDCEQALGLLADLVEADLSGKDADRLPFADVLAHLDTCVNCTNLYEDLSRKVREISGNE